MTEESLFDLYDRNHRRGEVLSCKISKIVSNIGLFVELAEGVQGIVHLSDIDWTKNWKLEGKELLSSYEVGQQIEVIILKIEPEFERVCLAIKQLKPGSDYGKGTDPHTPLPVDPNQPIRPSLSSAITPEKS